jgi:CubicO group peptidase (beta-lactamase class C family)
MKSEGMSPAPATVAVDLTRLAALVEWLDGFPAANIHSVVVRRKGELAFEHYRMGSDYRWAEALPNFVHGALTRHDLRSITKSITSLLVGIAIDQGHLAGIDEPVFSYFPNCADLRTPEKDGITLRHLLTMSAGFEWNEYIPYTDPTNSERQMLEAGDRWRFALTPNLVASPGAIWNYNGGSTELLGAVVSRGTGQAIDAYAREVLFSPLGIEDVEWLTYPDRIPAAASGLRLRAADLAKIGELVLARGLWRESRIVSASWIEESTRAHIGPDDRLTFYGYQWWLGRSLTDGRELSWIMAQGLGGQKLFIVPALDLVTVITAGHYSDPMEVWLPLLIFNRYVLPATQ